MIPATRQINRITRHLANVSKHQYNPKQPSNPKTFWSSALTHMCVWLQRGLHAHHVPRTGCFSSPPRSLLHGRMTAAVSASPQHHTAHRGCAPHGAVFPWTGAQPSSGPAMCPLSAWATAESSAFPYPVIRSQFKRIRGSLTRLPDLGLALPLSFWESLAHGCKSRLLL